MLITRTRGQIDTRIFSPLAVAGLCVTIGRYWYLFKRLTAISAGRFYRFAHIEAYSSFKAHSKQWAVSRPAYFFFDNGRCMFCAIQAQNKHSGGDTDAMKKNIFCLAL